MEGPAGKAPAENYPSAADQGACSPLGPPRSRNPAAGWAVVFSDHPPSTSLSFWMRQRARTPAGSFLFPARLFHLACLSAFRPFVLSEAQARPVIGRGIATPAALDLRPFRIRIGDLPLPLHPYPRSTVPSFWSLAPELASLHSECLVSGAFCWA